ncbi:hypothetical protein [Haliangium ochraceum]|uniref:Uncharacterized protein n=1 Tax=Haliangium ochraceum (strain DSM 14365 / JCM 11303 / SMP-2) TaxID=502025 RepID=D0LVY2_HALO1|nr:hypothetical protein [Haliangium ochraceum]ACY14116.1 conserved hypothetical protein [Haliangium ochraceum DSM 14365]
MSDEREVMYADLVHARERRDPRFAALVIAYLEQDDPPENAPEAPPTLADDDTAPPPLPADAWTTHKLRAALSQNQMYGKTPLERQALRREAWSALLAAKHPPPRLFLGDLLIDMYEQAGEGAGDPWARAQLMQVFREATLCWGLWRGFKQIYKRAEERHDAELFGVLAWRLDAVSYGEYNAQEITGATLSYMRRRAWRYLRMLGQSVSELFPPFAVQVLRHYPADASLTSSWVANHIWAHKQLEGERSVWLREPPSDLSQRAFDEAWKISPDPLLRLLEDAAHDHVCRFAIRSLKADFPDALREVDPRWLARVGSKNLVSVHEFAIELLADNPELAPARFAELGLREMVLGMLLSDSNKAAEYAVNYAKAHAPEIPVRLLVEVAENGSPPAKSFAVGRLEGMAPRDIGLATLIDLLASHELVKLARKKLDEGFGPDDLDAELYLRLATGDRDQQNYAAEMFKKAKRKVPAEFLRAVVESDEVASWQRRRVLTELGKRKARDIGVAWIQDALLDPRFSDSVAQWLRAGILAGDDLDVDWVKGLSTRPGQRSLALELLGNTKLVAPARLGLSWLLAMARHANDELSEFAHRYLLEHFAPEDFAEGGKRAAGVEVLWSLLGPDQPEPVRRFVSTYLRVHHPDIGATMAEARSHGIKPKLKHEDFSLARARPLLTDKRADVRRLAASVAERELVRWGEPALLYELAASRYREPRELAARALLPIGEAEAEPSLVPPVSWLSAGRVFALAESPVKPTREIALSLIRRHYDTLGGAEKLGWLMESPSREVRLFAVRLLWEKHRPLPGPRGDEVQRFDSLEAIRQFVRTVMFGLPPGRMERRDATGEALPDRPLAASVAKRRLLDVVREMAIENAEFAAMVAPVLEAFMHSQAKGEWQGCVAALARIRRAHPDIATALPAAEAP